MGTSLARALSRRGWSCTGWDPDPNARRRASRDLDLCPSRMEDALGPADLMVLCAPPEANLELLSRIPPEVETVTDVGSVKREIARRGHDVLGDRFVPGHPMAGSADSSGAAADANLFRGRPWILCGGGETHRHRVEHMAHAVGAVPRDLGPDTHDRAVAWTSHLPQILASLLVTEIDRGPSTSEVVGPGFESWSRLAGSPPELWQEILEGNQDAVLAAIDRYVSELSALREAWVEDPRAVMQLLRRGRDARARLARPRGTH